ncbi:hypothetical protein AQJ46_42230 [Streptomyces canus]|uniref:Uncharacterized protein n=1 Tax=Streptomyces canus TaxID=58343 RepID=A0A101RNR3_9ACTN|nr:hypothetical protein [Streptomyces canus]KUN58894.1 hypothetical protein AQJ46_42230 [Streptomyces canus]
MLITEYCPFHQVEDACGPMARLLEQAGLLALTPNAPAHPGQEAPAADDSAFGIPTAEVSLRRIVLRINTWGRTTLDPTIPRLDVAPGDVRSVRYALQALYETVQEKAGVDRQWWRVKDRLAQARAILARDAMADAEDARLSAYLAALHVDRAYTVWETEIKTVLGS